MHNGEDGRQDGDEEKGRTTRTGTGRQEKKGYNEVGRGVAGRGCGEHTEKNKRKEEEKKEGKKKEKRGKAARSEKIGKGRKVKERRKRG